MKKKLLLIDGNSIMNRAFYGIMGSKMLMTTDGKYTNAVYGFLAILFKNLEDLNPDYMAVSFDLKAKTARHKLYEGYKANRHGMPHTFATLTLASGATIDNVAKMLGHSDTKMTRHYARILDTSIMRDMQLVAKNMAQ